MSFFSKAVGKVVGLFSNSLSQKELRSDAIVGEAFEDIASVAREVAASGAVMLKNDGVLPLGNEPFALFGRTHVDTFYVGYGSGGDVRAPYRVSILQGVLNNENLNPDKKLIDVYTEWCKQNPVDHGFWAHWPWRYPEMPLSSDLVSDARSRLDKAVVVLGRAAGEDRENKLEQGSFFLHDEELNMLDVVTAHFDNVIVLMNIGNVIDFSWLKRYGDKIKGLLIVWQGGMETGNAVADVLSGKVSPDGKLPMAIANTYNDYPSSGDFGDRNFNFYSEDIYVGYRYFETFNKEAVLYPFGYGISYSNFDKSATVSKVDDGYEVTVDVKNVGDRTARETVQIYLSAPQGKLGKPAVVLAGYQKTDALNAGESQTVTVKVPYYLIASYDDSGVTGNKSSYVLEAGKYTLYLGNDCRDIKEIFSFELNELMVIDTVTEAGAPQEAFDRLRPVIEDGKMIEGTEPAPLRTVNLKERITENLPDAVPYTGNKGYKLIDVKNGKIDLDTFVAQLSNRELEAISRGDYTMHSKLGAKGNAGAMAGVLKSLRRKGVPAVITSDGPSGMRLAAVCSLAPIGTLLSSTWDTKLIEKLYSIIGKEMIVRGSDVLLAPGMNIHRNPLCGRNFEYFSEDPVLTGFTATAFVKGVQAHGASACPKHYACNNQETNRNRNDSRLSERALREIYLKGFELCIKEAKPRTIMTSYNLINGVWGHYNYDLCTTILRGEWGYEGMVMTDWWMQNSYSQEFPKVRNNGYRVRAQVDVLMPGGGRLGIRIPNRSLLETLGRPDGITRGELLRTAKNVLNLALNSPALTRK